MTQGISLRHDHAGNFMVSASTEGPIFFYSSKPSANFEVLGYLGMLILINSAGKNFVVEKNYMISRIYYFLVKPR